MAIGLGLAWCISILLCLPPLFRVAPYSYSTYLGACAPDFTVGDGVIWYSTIYTALTLLLPAALILGCNIKVSIFPYLMKTMVWGESGMSKRTT